MLLYYGSTVKFKEDVLSNKIADLLRTAFREYSGYDISRSEYSAFQNSPQYLKNLIDLSSLNDNFISLEYEVPYNTGRIDCMLFGKGQDSKDYAVLIELKQWSKVEEVEGEDNFVETFTGGASRKVSHPSQQVEGYHNHLINFVQIFEVDPNYDLYSCAYCHNYHKKPGLGLFAERYQKIVEQFPVYCKEDVTTLAKKLKALLGKGNGFEIFNRFMQSPIKPSRKLLENVANIVEKNKAVFSLLNEQLVAKNVIMSKVKQAEKKKLKGVIVIHGGPGTGKTVIALNVLADLARRKKFVLYGCKSKPFREALEKLVGTTSRILFSNLTRFLPSRVKEDSIDVVLIDEAHRIASNSNARYTKRADRTDMPQIDQVIRCAKTAVFFIDDNQTVRFQEVGSSQLIKASAEKFDASYEDVHLVSQFRCAGSDNYLDWLEYILGYKEKPVDLTKDERFEFKIFDDPNKLYHVIKAYELKKPNSARLVAGYCWPWSKELNQDGSLIKDVVIGEYGFAMPWEAQDNYVGQLQNGIPKWYQWAYKLGGVEQIGCIYTAQGFEFDYIGVIVGLDLKYDRERDCLICDISANCDPTLRRDAANFDTYVKNIYRVLMTRGMKGCYVYFCDKEVEAYFRRHIHGDPNYVEPLMYSDILSDEQENIIKVEIEDHLKYTEFLPLYTAEAACGQFGEGRVVEQQGWVKVDGVGILNRNMFVVRAVGRSMEPKINDGDYCIFRSNVVGSRQNKIVLVQHSSINDAEMGGQYTIKKYISKKKPHLTEEWKHEEIQLLPLNSEYNPIIINNPNEGEFMVIAEFLCVLN